MNEAHSSSWGIGKKFRPPVPIHIRFAEELIFNHFYKSVFLLLDQKSLASGETKQQLLIINWLKYSSIFLIEAKNFNGTAQARRVAINNDHLSF